VSLRRNRDFVLYQAGQLLSSTGSSFTSVAYPLLALALTHSPAKAGIVAFVRLAPAPLLGIAAGIASDRFDRRRIMIGADALRAAALLAIAALVWRSDVFWPLVPLAFVDGTGDVFFGACSGAVLRSVVPAAELPEAVSVQTGSGATVGIVGTPVGGALFALARALPFAVDAVSFLASTVAMLAMRTPFQQPRAPRTATVREDVAEGFRLCGGSPSSARRRSSTRPGT
jgi:MFS family permease